MIAPGTLGFLLLCVGGYVIFASTLAYSLFATDKQRAVAGMWRVPEGTLLLVALAGGWPGAKLAQRRLRHKTRKQPFGATLNLIGLAQGGVLALVLVPAGWLPAGLGEAVAAGVSALEEGFQPAPAETRVTPRRFGPGSD